MSGDELIQKLEQLHTKVIDELLTKINAGLATSQDLALAWKLLQDNGVPLADLRKKAGGELQSADAEEFVKNLPFPSVNHG